MSMNSSKSPEISTSEKFKVNIIDLTDLIHELISECFEQKKTWIPPALILTVGGFIQGFNSDIMIRKFIELSFPYWTEINKREENFFISNCQQIFSKLVGNETKNEYDEQVNAFKELFQAKDEKGKSIITNDDKDAIWDYFNSLICLCIQYIHKVRIPSISKKEMADQTYIKIVYKKKEFPEIKLGVWADLFKVELNV